ncbi:hypothetical protein [uncultured Mitsuokella sp.]|uniref:hypothetical protein n=1 Tax=uncultured Mitsuokella sp. TaxID=453120 RepID=UPI0025986DF1|nr:hypothetical protein [uncultured Mitsuokella sp.]
MKSMKLRFLAMLVAAVAAIYVPTACSAAYVTAYEQHVDEKYVVDTSTVYRPDAEHINVGVYYTDNIKNKTYPYVYKFWYNTGRGAWYILEQKNAPESGDISTRTTRTTGPSSRRRASRRMSSRSSWLMRAEERKSCI